MKIWLYTVTYNEAKILPFFLRHYAQFCERITVIDDNSTDGTRQIVEDGSWKMADGRDCQCVLEKYPYDGKLDDRQFIQLARDTYPRARGHADWVIWCDPDEFLYHPRLMEALDALLKSGVQVPITRGFQMISDHFPNSGAGILPAGSGNEHAGKMAAPLQSCEECDRLKWPTTQPLYGVEGRTLCWTHAQSVAPNIEKFPIPAGKMPAPLQITELVTEGIEDPVYAKPVIFQPGVEMNWEPGKHYVHGNFTRGKYAGLKVLHYRCLGLEYLRERHARNFSRCSKENIAAGFGSGVYPNHQGHMSEKWFTDLLPQRRPVLDHSTFHELVRVLHQGKNPFAEFRHLTPSPSARSSGGEGSSEEGTESLVTRHSSLDLVLQPDWGSEHPWLHETIERIKPQVLIEVGTFLGRSALHTAQKLKDLGLDSALICVDTWLGDHEHWSHPEVRPLLKHRLGRPEFYHTFLSNVQCAGLSNFIIPLPMDSVSGARYLSLSGVHADMIYIDGGHTGGEVYRDLVNYWTLLRSGGAMIMDDFGDARFPGLQADVERFAKENKLVLEQSGHKARVWKN